jgi:hypothetical protein
LTGTDLQTLEGQFTQTDPEAWWAGAVAMGEYCESEPGSIWPLTVKYASHDHAEMRMAIASCVLEHLLEFHFDPYFGLSRDIIRSGNRAFADTFSHCWKVGEADRPENAAKFDALVTEIKAAP